MNRLQLDKILKRAKKIFGKYSPEILTGMGLAGMAAAAVLAVRATPKALTLLEEKRKEEKSETLSPTETIKTAWHCYIPAAVTGTVSAACIIGASRVNQRRNAALAAAYSLTEAALTDYQNGVLCVVGEKKEQEVRDNVASRRIERHSPLEQTVILTGNGRTLCFDTVSGRYFYSDIETLKRVENVLNRQMRDEMCISLNDFYDEVGLPGIEIGDELGWNLDRGYIDLDFSSQLTEDGTPCLVVSHHVAPRYCYL